MTYPVPDRLVIATGNKGKLTEFKQMFARCSCKVISQDQFGVSDIAETGLTFVENAIIKARAAAKASGLPALADDSGIEVDVLAGQPGIYSARFAGEHATDEENINKMLQALKDVPSVQRVARYQCMIVLMKSDIDPSPLIFSGSWEGRILEAPAGNGGFGYDSIFFVPQEHLTAAQMTSAHKNKISHRGQAISSLCKFLFD